MVLQRLKLGLPCLSDSRPERSAGTAGGQLLRGCSFHTTHHVGYASLEHIRHAANIVTVGTYVPLSPMLGVGLGPKAR